MSGDEYYFPGGLYFEGSGEPEDRVDTYLQESGPGKNEAEGTPLTLSLRFVSGNIDFCLVAILPNDVMTLGTWMVDVARRVKERNK